MGGKRFADELWELFGLAYCHPWILLREGVIRHAPLPHNQIGETVVPYIGKEVPDSTLPAKRRGSRLVSFFAPFLAPRRRSFRACTGLIYFFHWGSDMRGKQTTRTTLPTQKTSSALSTDDDKGVNHLSDLWADWE